MIIDERNQRINATTPLSFRIVRREEAARLRRDQWQSDLRQYILLILRAINLWDRSVSKDKAA